MDPVEARKIAGDIASSNDIDVCRRALAAVDDTVALHALAVEALGDPSPDAAIWAASYLIDDEEHTDAAIQVVTDAAVHAMPKERVVALKALIDVEPEEAVTGMADAVTTISDPDLRHEVVYALSETLGYGGEDVLADLLADADEWVAITAAEELARHGDQRGFDALTRVVLAGDHRAARAVETLTHSARPHHIAVAKRLLRRRSAAARQLGARLLAICDPPPADEELAIALLDDPDPTVRCAIAWSLARRGRTDALVPRVDRLLADVEPIAGPPLDDPRTMHWANRAQPVRCCADIVYRWLAEHPAMLGEAVASHVAGGIFRPMPS